MPQFICMEDKVVSHLPQKDILLRFHIGDLTLINQGHMKALISSLEKCFKCFRHKDHISMKNFVHGS